MGQTSKQKGARYERKVCQRLSLWVTDLAREDVFWRSAMSGGRATRRARTRHDARPGAGRRIAKDDTQRGDISAIHHAGELLLKLFLVECKHMKNLGMEGTVWGEGPQLDRIWRPYVASAKASGRCPMVIAKQNNRDDLVLTTRSGEFVLATGREHDDDFQQLAYFPRDDMAVYRFRDMLTELSFSRIREIYEPRSRPIPRKTLRGSRG